MEITYLEEIYHSVYKTFCSAIDHLDYHHSINSTMWTDLMDFPITSHAETLCKMCTAGSPPYVPRRQYGELSPTEGIFLDQLLIALEKINVDDMLLRP